MDTVYRASELGGCTRFLIGKRMGYTEMPPPQKFQQYFDRGNEMEETLVDLLTGDGYEMHSRQETVELVVSPSVSVVGHIDGTIFDGEQMYLWECKRMTPRWFDDMRLKGWESSYPLLEKYKWQVSAYMIAKDLELRLDIACERDGVLERWCLFKELPFYSELQIKTRVLGIEAAAQQGQLGETCDKPNYPCPLYYLPGHDSEDDTDEDDKVSSLCLAIAESKKDVDAATKRDKQLRRELLTVMGERKRVRTEVATVSVQHSYKTITDKVRMEADGFKLEDYQTKEEGDAYVRITPRKGTGKDEAETD